MKSSNVRKLYVGIDVHSKEHQAAIIPLTLLERPGGMWRKLRPLAIRNNITDFERLDAQMKQHVSGPDEVAVAVDHTGGHYSEPLVYFLQGRGYVVHHLETRAVKAARERFLDEENKSDKIDAAGAAYLLYLRDLHGLSFRISEVTADLGSRAAVLNSLVLQRWQFNKLATQTTNRLRQLLIAVFPEGESICFRQIMKITHHYPMPKDILASNGLEGIKGIRAAAKARILELAANSAGIRGDVYRDLIKDLTTQRSEALAKRDALTSAIRTQVAEHPYGHILLSFPQLGAIAAATIIATIKEIERWPDKKKLKKALGVYNRLTQSGISPGRNRQGREGSKHGRRVLYQVCMGCLKRNMRENDFRDYYLRQVAQGKVGMKALVSAMGKLAEIIYHCVRAGEPYQYQGKYRPTRKSDPEGS